MPTTQGTVMQGKIYALVGNGELTTAWMAECLSLFKGQSVNIKKLVFREDFRHPIKRLEIDFVLPDGCEDFLEKLKTQMKGVQFDCRHLS